MRDLARADTTRDVVARRWLHMLPSDTQAELVLSHRAVRVLLDVEMATHGTPNDYDSHVPEIFYGPWFIAGQVRTSEARSRTWRQRSPRSRT